MFVILEDKTWLHQKTKKPYHITYMKFSDRATARDLKPWYRLIILPLILCVHDVIHNNNIFISICMRHVTLRHMDVAM